MNEPEKKYWDSSCFICFLNEDERERRLICTDILENAQKGNVEIWTSTWTIVEVIRPKKHGSAPLPDWAVKAIEAIQKEFPDAQNELETLWNRYQRSDPATRLTPEQIEKIQNMFAWSWIKKVDLDERVATDAVQLARTYGLKPADSVHAASAIISPATVLQRWDRDFDKVKDLITSEDPKYISVQGKLFDIPSIAPMPADFQEPETAMEEHAAESEIKEITEVPSDGEQELQNDQSNINK